VRAGPVIGELRAIAATRSRHGGNSREPAARKTAAGVLAHRRPQFGPF
jgi:hypothetical protein